MIAPLVIAGRSFGSRLLLGTGGFTRMATLADAIDASETELVAGVLDGAAVPPAFAAGRFARTRAGAAA